MPDKPLSIGINVTFAEAIQAAERRGVVLPEVYYGELQGLARQLAFSIAGVASYDQLSAVKDSLDAAIAQGQTFQKWKNETSQQVLELPKYRLDNIFRTNIQSNYARGHWQKYQETKRIAPYLMYDAINDARVRHSHLALDGIIRAVDDPFWDTHAPLNGYRCRCTLIQLTEKQARARSGSGKGLNMPETDEMQPDSGWAYNPGADIFAGVDSALDRIASAEGNKHMQYAAEAMIKNELMLQRWANFEGIESEEYRRRIRKNLQRIAKDSPIYVRANKKSIEDALTNGELPQSAGGMQSKEWQFWQSEYKRNFIDAVLGDTGGDAVSTGYLADDDVAAMRNLTLNLTHGDIAIRLKPGVKKRSTLIGGDIVSTLNNRGSIARSFDDVDERILQYQSTGKSKSPLSIDRASYSEINYLQANIFGAVNIDDIESIIFDAQPSQKLIKLLEKTGVSWRVIDKTETNVVFDDILQF